MGPGMIQLQKQFVDALKMPKYEIGPFDGNAVNYFQFICESESIIGCYTMDEHEKLNRLIQVKEVLRPFQVMAPNIGYPATLDELKDMYGDEVLIADALLQAIMDFPEVKMHRLQTLQKFITKVRAMFNTLTAMGRIYEVDIQGKIKQLMKKLPDELRGKYGSRAAKYKKQHRKHPPLRMLIEYLTDMYEEYPHLWFIQQRNN